MNKLIAALILSLSATVAVAEECSTAACFLREMEEAGDRYNARASRDLDRVERMQERMEADVDRANYRDRTLCQPAEDCRRTTVRRSYR
jgi:predicted phage-related endonuclease